MEGDLSDLNHELIKELLRSGKISKEDVEIARILALTDKAKEVIEQLHAYFCTLNHDKGDDDKGCIWYEESKMPDTWEQDCHRRWIEIFRGLKTHLRINSDNDMSRLTAALGYVNIIRPVDTDLSTFLLAIAVTLEHLISPATSEELAQVHQTQTPEVVLEFPDL